MKLVQLIQTNEGFKFPTYRKGNSPFYAYDGEYQENIEVYNSDGVYIGVLHDISEDEPIYN